MSNKMPVTLSHEEYVEYLNLRNRIDSVKELRDIQGKSDCEGNYMRGLYNGLELSLATLEGRQPKYRTKTNDEN